jgi:3-dehydroquinate synthetase
MSVIERAVAVKAQVVAEDERELGRRAILNLGHTMGHAFEAETEFGALRHGDAVSLGIRFALALSVKKLHMPAGSVHRVTQVLDTLGGPNDWAERVNSAVLDRIDLDKKKKGSVVRAICLRDLGDPVVLDIELTEFKELVIELATAERERKQR